MKMDLNLFVVFEAIYCEGNISKAASALNLSQPAVSHSLAKLRAQFDDKLFIRQGNQMKPTALAKNVIGDVREALHQLQSSVYQAQKFEPSTSRKYCTVSLHGSLEASYLPLFAEQLLTESPNMNFTSKRVRRSELENKLASGDIDIAIDILLPVSSNVVHQQLTKDKLVVVARQNHPIFTGKLDLQRYLSQTHVVASTRTSGPSLEDYELGRLGIQRKVALRCQHLLSACRVIANNDMLLTIPEKSAKMYRELLPISIAPLPIELPPLDVHIYWHSNVDQDPANTWLRNKVIAAQQPNS
ncbi:LysR family transcriptional regulator [Thalassotalea euphylliae]|uniref:LysR family transcriptional regulator n=1 Tax=Thalassotalea euphylliae TaxID=1655234 RepID=A0A3E0TYR9_9GAMM|nr:LysR family transcriptional regulator [Thalassotalea euphylliae]REL29547.1 LysR family transcriptional regulator [Thalassotalea euphylliae]